MYRWLKFELLCRGVAPDPTAINALPLYQRRMVVVRDYPTTSGLILRLPEDHYVNARLRLGHPDAFPLRHDGDGFVLQVGDDAVGVEVLPPPRYALENRRLASGKSIRNVAMTHADRIRLTPLFGCAFHCQFCNYPNIVYRRNSIDELRESLEIALADNILADPHVLVSGGTPHAEKRDYDYANDVYSVMPRLFPALTWDLMVAPRPLHPGPSTRRTYANFIDRLKSWGFDALSVNLELYGDDARQRYIPEKAKIGKEGYLTFLELAVERFGRGKVRSVILVGLEEEHEILSAVADLSQRGVLVELSPFTADPGIFLARHGEPSAEILISVHDKAEEIAMLYGMTMTPFCIRCSHNILS